MDRAEEPDAGAGMSQKILNGKTDCRKSKSKGCATIRFDGNNKEIMEGIQRVHEKYPCIVIRVNGKKLEEIPKGWDGDPE